ncbi:MAG TPA: tetratricopeptide repeat protein [Gemmataceae bacterium]|jgi:tetratricopeptide (TPR) repeat protein|nr:tetratricopeptide repeat protein [Gemmataceae bacterium]
MSGPISLCMIARNEEANLTHCLEPMKALIDEIILVDTGSSDRTKEVATRLGAHVFDFPWIDDFSAARNVSLRHASCPWIFWLDADDRVDEKNRQRLQMLFGTLRDDNAAYLMKCQGMANATTGSASITDHVRMFRNHAEVRWQHRVHEQILPALCRLGADVRSTDIVIHHTGYLDPAFRVRKAERNLRLLERAAAETPDDTHALFYLGQTHLMLGAPQRALPFLRECRKHADPLNPLTSRLYVLLTQALHQAGELPEALSICQAGGRYFPDNPDLLFLEGVIRQKTGDAAGAETCLQRLLAAPAESRSVSMDTTMYFKARHRLALDYLRQGRHEEAEGQWRTILADNPRFVQAWLGLTDVYLARGRPEVWEPFLQSVVAVPQNGLNFALVKARLKEAQGDVPAARMHLEEACSHHGQSLWPHIALARLLLTEGRDWAAAEQALLAVLALDPNHGEALRNLGLLRQRLGTAAEQMPPASAGGSTVVGGW